MKKRDKIVLGVVLAIVAGAAVWLLTCTKCALPPAPPTVVAPKEPLTEDIVGERMADPVYVDALKGLIDQRSEVIAEAHTVRRQMEAILAASEKVAGASSSPEKVAGASSSPAEKVAGASSSPAEQQDPEQAVSGEPQERELEAPATMAATNAPLVSTNTALKAGTQLSAPDVPPSARFDGIDPALLAHVRQQPEWTELETRLNALAAKQQGIQLRTETLIRERMKEQYAARAAEKTGPITRPPAHVIKTMTNAPDFNAVEPIILTNVPPGGVKLPPLPDRKPVK